MSKRPEQVSPIRCCSIHELTGNWLSYLVFSGLSDAVDSEELFSARLPNSSVKYARYLSTTLRKMVSGSRISKVIREMMRKEMKWKEKSMRSEATLTACMDDYGVNGDSNLSHNACASNKEDSQSTTDNKKEKLWKTKDLQCMMTHALASTALTDSPSVSSHFTHCWAFHSVLRVVNSISRCSTNVFSFYPVREFLVQLHTAKTVLWGVVFTPPVDCSRPRSAVNDPIVTKEENRESRTSEVFYKEQTTGLPVLSCRFARKLMCGVSFELLSAPPEIAPLPTTGGRTRWLLPSLSFSRFLV